MHKVIGKFKIHKVLGSGKTSTVYLGIDDFTNEKVAVKVTNSNVFDETNHGDTCQKMFINEASLAGRLSHPHIVSVQDAGMHESDLYIVMEYVKGVNLKNYCDENNLLPVNQIVDIIFKCCSALDYALSKGVIHRDIKPANIILAEEGDIKIMDFGSALLSDIDTVQLSHLVGSPAYMAPEIIKGEEATCQSDIYSLGITLFQLLTGHHPYPSKKIDELLRQKLNDKPLDIRYFRTDLPKKLEDIIKKATMRDKNERYSTWQAFGYDLANIQDIELGNVTNMRESTRFNLLRKMKLFVPFSDAELWELLHLSQWLECPPDIRLIKENVAGSSFFISITGSAKVTKEGVLLGMVNAGEPIGEMSYITGAPRTATVHTMTDSIIVKFRVNDLKKASTNLQIAMSFALLKVVTIRLQKTSNLVIDLQSSMSFNFNTF